MLSKSHLRLLFTKRVCGIYRTLVTETNVEENVEPVKKKTARKKPTELQKRSKDIMSYFNTPERQHVLNNFPESMLRRKTKIPEDLYCTSESVARKIVDHLKQDLPPERPVLEVFPGEGHVTKLLLNETQNKLILYEPEGKFHKNLETIIKQNPKRDVILKNIDLTSLWKFLMIDKMDHGTRTDDALKDIIRKDYDDEPNVRIFVSSCSLPFIKHLINAITFQHSLIAFGRCELYMCLPPPLFIHLTCSRDAGYMMYRATSVLFQLFFEYEFICKFNRKDFLPWQTEMKAVRYAKIQKYTQIDPESIYLVKIVPRKDLFKFLLPDNLVPFWYFVKQHFISRKNRVIPSMERWIPNCGPRLIVNPNQSVPPKLMNPNIDLSSLPTLTQPCYELSNQDYVKNFHIFTEFGDLTPSQVLTLFDRFINWPEFRECSFTASMESALIKMHTNPDESVESRDLVEEVDDDEEKKV